MQLPKAGSPHVRHAVKTSLAAVTAYALTTLFALPQGYWAVISVIVVMQANLGGSFQAGVNRIVGTAVGAAMGLACLYTLGSGSLALGLGVGLTILVCAYFIHLHESFRMAGLTAAIIILLGGQSSTYLHFAVLRFLEIALGVAVALSWSALLWPSRAGRLFKQGVARALSDEAAFYSLLLSSRVASGEDILEENAARSRLRATRDRNAALLEEAKKEPAGLSRRDHITVSLFNFTERIAEHLLAMEHAAHPGGLESLHALAAGETDLLAQTTITAMTRLALAIGQDRDPGPAEDLKRALRLSDEALGRVRKQRVLPSYELEEVMRFFSYYYNVREVACELIGMAERAAMPGEA